MQAVRFLGGLPLMLLDSSGLWSAGSDDWASGYFLAARRPILGVALAGTVAFGVVLGEAALAGVALGVPRVFAADALTVLLGVDVWPALGAAGSKSRCEHGTGECLAYIVIKKLQF